ncbi:MAG TPA: Hsp20/alpha crystallin family protein [Chloroflexia bacterium]|nr:Hsp20/alpha crystallin family protein [Chloroflexia bacterium]
MLLDSRINRTQGSLWREMAQLQNEMSRLASRQTETSNFPALNLWATQDSAVLTAELPGIDMQDLELTVVGDTLTLRGKRAPEQLQEGNSYHRRERGWGNFARLVQLPYRVEQEEVSANYKNGVLSITLPRAHADRPRKIEVKTA